MNEMQSKTDEELVKMSIKDPENFYYLMQRYEAKLKRYVHRISNFNEQSVEDIVQDVFIKAYKNLRSYNNKIATFSSWIYRIAHNESVSFIRKIKCRPQTVNNNDEDGVDFLEILPSHHNITEDYKRKELGKKVRKIIMKLPKKYRHVLILRYIEDKDYQEISDILKKPLGTVGTLLNRAKKKFEKLMKKDTL